MSRLRFALLLVALAVALVVLVPLVTWAGITFWEWINSTPSGVGHEHY